MNDTRWMAALAVVYNIMIASLVATAMHCGPKDGANDPSVSYTAEQLACVEKAHTLDESRTCRCAVKKRYNRPCTDGGTE